MTEGGLNIGKLACLCIAPHLQHGLSQSKHRARIAGVAVRQHTAMSIEWLGSPGARHATGEEVASFTLTAESKVLELNQQRGCEAVVELHEIDLIGCETGGSVSGIAG